ncbi:TatD family hydrolase [Candidatus Saccharibacteria bacterium]|nr:TatD family hydrolase [Candidatus Saccharibacteria bacterium]
MLSFVDTHCHIHAAKPSRKDFTANKWHESGRKDPEELLVSAKKFGVSRLICVGTDLEDSRDAIEFAGKNEGVWASLGIHPHEAAKYKELPSAEVEKLIKKPKVVAIGEVGLDYYYEHSPRAAQIKLLEMFLGQAEESDLPVIFHVRDAFDDFWPILNNFKNIRGVLHSFTADKEVLKQGLSNNLYIGLNGIMTFTKDENQLEMAKLVPLDRLVLETDAPYLTPKPFRGKVCRPEHVVNTAEFLADLRGERVEDMAKQTTKNACNIFGINF